MVVCVDTILDCATMASGKLPDIYWELPLTGSELKVLKYVFENCFRLYTEYKWFPKGMDGSPRFWRSKEKMADDCGVSYPTFRNSIRKLHSLGLTTSMDADTGDNEPFCVGLSCEFLFSLLTENNFRLHTLYSSVLDILYNKHTVSIIREKEELKFFLLRKKKASPASSTAGEIYGEAEQVNTQKNQEQYTHFLSGKEATEQCSPTENKKKHVKRKPIKIERYPINHTIPSVMKQQTLQQKLKLLKHVLTPKEKHIHQIAQYYEYRCRVAMNINAYISLPKTNKKRYDLNWKYYTKIYELLEENDWDYKVYIDSQFDRVKYWEHDQVYPYLNQMFSENAIKCYNNYVKNIKESSSITGRIEAKGDEVKTTRGFIIDRVTEDCEKISDNIERMSKRRNYKDLSKIELKLLYISDHWMGMSPYYLSCIPWFGQYLSTFPQDEPLVKHLVDDINKVSKSNAMLLQTKEIVEQVETQLNVPTEMEI